MRILGLDISSVATGWCVLKHGRVIGGGVIRPVEGLRQFYGTKANTRRNIDQIDQAVYIATQVAAVVEKFEADRLVIEDCFLGSNVRTLQLLARLSGAAIYAWFRDIDNTKPVIVTAMEVRSYLGCSPKAEKKDIVRFIKSKYGLVLESHDIADAFMVARYYYEKYAENESAEPVASIFTSENIAKVFEGVESDPNWHYCGDL
jgi:Holliday junction resolvasome RuvABC endonuclease subunit